MITLPDFSNAVCITVGNPDAWHADSGGQYEPYAKNLCHRCPQEASCLDYALANDESGVWGGTTYEERQEIVTVLGLTVKKYDTSDYVQRTLGVMTDEELADAYAG